MKAVDRRGSRAADCVSVPSITGLLMKACERDRRSLGFGCFSPLYNGALNEGRTSSSRGRTHRQGFSPLYNGALNEGLCHRHCLPARAVSVPSITGLLMKEWET